MLEQSVSINELAITIYAALEGQQLGLSDAATAFSLRSPHERARYVHAAEAVAEVLIRRNNSLLHARAHPLGH